ncbi:uncharacterized protein [Aristolochia californica]|uniref:uncharacterized protein n=1 Tax=Aristolochia californica TaxID=171875 RepID=UPI0035D73729
MEKEGNDNQRIPETDLFLQWGNRKRHRCFKVKKEEALEKSDGSSRTRSNNRVVRAETDAPVLHPKRLNRISDSAARIENRKSHSSSPDKEDRYYTTRGSMFEDGGGKLFPDGVGLAERGFVWPRFYICLSSKEKEEDFMAMKGCKLPQRPKKRAKYIQKSLLLVSPGAWLSDLSHERYEVREKKSSKKRPRGLKAMGSIESDSD